MGAYLSFRDSLRISSGKWRGLWYSNPGQPELLWFRSDFLLGINHKIHSSEEGPLLNRFHIWYCSLLVAIPDHSILSRPSLIFSVTIPPLLPSQYLITAGYFISGCMYVGTWTSLVPQMVKNPAMWETWVWSLGWEDLLEEGMATHSHILAWRIPWIEETGRLQSIESQSRRQLSD